MTITTSPRLQFDRTGDRVVAVDGGGLTVIDRGDRAAHVACADVRAVCGFDGQVWAATADRLWRFDDGGRAIGEPFELPSAGECALVAAPHGPPGAMWSSSPTVAIVDDLGELVVHEHPIADAIVPVTARRAIVAVHGRVVMPSGIATDLAPGSRVLGGAVFADGRHAVLVVATGGRRHLVVVSLGTGHVTSRIEIPVGGAVRIAHRRAIAMLAGDPSAIDIVDLRTGRASGRCAIEGPVDDLAVDPDGHRVAVLRSHGVEVVALADLVRASRQRPTRAGSTVDDAVAIVEASEPASPALDVVGPTSGAVAIQLPLAVTAIDEPGPQPSPPPARPPRMPHARGTPRPMPAVRPPIERRPLAAFAPRRSPPPVDRDVALAQLDRELRAASLWALCAIADAWDSRRLGYGNEGKHPFELEVAAILGMSQGFATEHVAAARDHLADHERLVAGDAMHRAPGTPVGDLIAELALSARAVDVVVVVAAAALRGEIARLYGILANDPGRAVVDEQLVHQVLGTRHARHDLAAELDPRARLIRLGIVRVDGRRARPFAELSIDPVILDRLRAETPALGPATDVRGGDRDLDAIDVAGDVLERALAALDRPTRGPARIAVRGRAGTGRRTLLAALARDAGRDLAVIDAVQLPRDAAAFQLALAQALRAAHLAGHVPGVVGLDRVSFGDVAGRDVASDAIRAHPGVVAVIAEATAPVPFAAGHVAIDLPVLPETDRVAVWTRALAGAGLAVADVDGLAARYRVGPGVIHRAVDAARIQRAGDDATASLEHFIRQTRDAALGNHARRVDHLATWSSVVLPPDVLDSLRELIGRVRHRRTVFEDWGMGRAMTTSRGLTALFQGQPGTGKTMVAGVIARELGLDLYQVDLSRVMSKWIGETERNLAEIFDAAEDGQVVLLFDEADSLFAKRTEVRSSNDRYANLEVNYLLQRLDSFEGIAILTTNVGGSIDPALKRRMSFRLSFPFPDEETREQLWRAHLPPELPIAGELALAALARKYQLSGGYIRNACLRAAFLAAQSESALHQHHLERAVALEFAEIGKLSTAGAVG